MLYWMGHLQVFFYICQLYMSDLSDTEGVEKDNKCLC